MNLDFRVLHVQFQAMFLPIVAFFCQFYLETRKSIYPVLYGSSKQIIPVSQTCYDSSVSFAFLQRSELVIIEACMSTGSMEAACDLFKEAQCQLLGCLCLIELEDLKGRDKLKDIPFHSIIKY